MHSKGLVRTIYKRKHLDNASLFCAAHFPDQGTKPIPAATYGAPALPLVKAGDLAKRYALVIGNSAYLTSPLANPVNDSDAVADTLRKLGFSVIQRNNTTLREMENATNEFYGKLTKDSVGLFYYAGHGLQVDGRNYLVPVDAVIGSNSDVKYTCMDAGRVLGKMEDAGNGMNIVILDACRNSPFSSTTRSLERGLARIDAPTGSIIAYSTAPGKTAADGSGKNGVYTQCLLRHMTTPGLPVSDVFIRTRMDVLRETGGRQVPWESSSLAGYFYFSAPKAQ